MTDWSAVREAIFAQLKDPKHDDGSWGPLYIRLAWHCSGTYSVFDKTGGSNGARQRFAPEAEWGANAGLGAARARLEAVKDQFPGVSYADLYTLAGVVAVAALGGPEVPWKSGRTDAKDGATSPPDGRLPDAAKDADHMRAIFYRMPFSDREIVALTGAHAVGRCHANTSGFDGPWTATPTKFSNLYYKELLGREWKLITLDNGVEQYMDEDREVMMTPAEFSLYTDAQFRPYVELYAKDKGLFFKDFAAAFGKLLALGCMQVASCPYLTSSL